MPNAQNAIEFLQHMLPDAPWCLVARDPDDPKGQRVLTVQPDNPDTAEAWIRKMNGESRNIYYHPNPPRERVFKEGVSEHTGKPWKFETKPKREHIAEVRYLSVDLDPQEVDGRWETPAEAKARYRLVLEDLSDPATVVVDTGGGLQAYWRLEEPIALDGSLETAVDASTYSKRLAQDLGGDSTHNVDRLHRVPFTVNFPDERKRKKGRTEVESMLVWQSDKTYDIDEFAKAEPDAIKHEQPRTGGRRPHTRPWNHPRPDRTAVGHGPVLAHRVEAATPSRLGRV